MAEPAAHPEVPVEHAPPAAFGFVTAPVVVALCITLVILFLIWKKVPAAIGRSLDKKIEAIRAQLNEAESIRKDAEALKADPANYIAQPTIQLSTSPCLIDGVIEARHVDLVSAWREQHRVPFFCQLLRAADRGLEARRALDRVGGAA